VTLSFVPADAEITWNVDVISCGSKGCLVKIGDNRVSTTVTLGTIDKGQEIRVFIHSSQPGTHGFESGPASRNIYDQLAHAIVIQKMDKLSVAFEDTDGWGDHDFNDVVLELEGARMEAPFTGVPISPSAGSNFAFNPSGGVDVTPILVGDRSGASITLGEADGWQGTVDFDGHAPSAQLTYAVQSASGLPDLVASHTTSADGWTDLALSFPRATGRATLQVDAFLAGQKVASSQVQPGPDHSLTFAPLRFLDARKAKTITVRKSTLATTAGPISQERVGIATGATQGEITGFGNVSFDALELTFSDGGFPTSGFSEVSFSASPGASLTVEDDQSLSVFHQLHRALDGGVFEAGGGTLTLQHGVAADEDPGVAIALADVEAFDLTWSPFLPLGLTASGSSVEVNTRGTVKGVTDQDLGTLRVTQLTMADTDAEITADYSAIGSPTQRILLYDQGHLVADVTGHTGAAARALAWPTGIGKGNVILGSRVLYYSLPFPEDTWIRIPGGPWMRGDRLLVLAENPQADVDSLSQLSLRTTSLPPITLTGEAVTPVTP